MISHLAAAAALHSLLPMLPVLHEANSVVAMAALFPFLPCLSLVLLPDSWTHRRHTWTLQKMPLFMQMHG